MGRVSRELRACRHLRHDVRRDRTGLADIGRTAVLHTVVIVFVLGPDFILGLCVPGDDGRTQKSSGFHA